MNKLIKIDSIELFIISIPLKSPFETSLKKITHKEALILKINSGDFSGWGECGADPDPFYYHETIKTSLYITENFFLPILFNKNDISIEDCQNIFSVVRGHNMAKAMIENALLDLFAKQMEMPLYKLLGGQYKEIMSGISIGIKNDTDILIKHIQNSVEKGYQRIKVKIKKGYDIDLLKAIRSEFPNISLMADANGDYGHDDINSLKKLDDLNLMMIEQPFDQDDFYGHTLLQKELNTPVCLDESIVSLNSVQTAIYLKSCRVINIKQSRLGGMLNAKIIQNHCMKNNIEVWSGGMLETGIGRAFNIHLQTLPGFTLPGDTSETSRYFHEDILSDPVVLNSNGFIRIPDGNGIGCEVVQKRIEKYKVFFKKIDNKY